ncbi:MAG TPA: GNAT family N-acetyltransferase, partial [bacterium]|nr:GNAT family N-acetyltransferase [bacterium]
NNPNHRDRVRQIVWDTGFGGDGMEPFFDDIDLFADMLTLYYTDYDSSHNFLALADGEVAGYLLGCPDTSVYEETMKEEILPYMLKKLLRGEYKLSRKNLRYLRRSIMVLLRKEMVPVPLDKYPAHLHIDFDSRFRRIGLGSELINTYLDYLRGMGVPGVHLGTSTVHKTALPFYRKLGFTELGRVRITEHFYLEVSQEDMYGITFVKKL